MMADIYAPPVRENTRATSPKPSGKKARTTAAPSKKKEKKEGLIQRKMYFGGKVQGLGFQDGSIYHETCVIMPGEYDFGAAERTETITCTFNEMTVNGVTIKPGSRPFVIRPGDPIKVSAEHAAIYHSMCK
jgi:uncharacterized protein YaiE (UPF0345 family)